MKLLATYNNLPASRLIRNILSEPASHVAIQYGQFVVHSNFRGVRVESLAHFTQSNKIAGSVQIPSRPERLFSLLGRFENARYDYGALLYLGLRYLGFPLPKSNLWQSTGMFLCTEWATQLLGEVDSMITPWQLYLKMGGKPCK